MQMLSRLAVSLTWSLTIILRILGFDLLKFGLGLRTDHEECQAALVSSCNAPLRFGHQRNAELIERVGEQSHSLNSPQDFV